MKRLLFGAGLLLALLMTTSALATVMKIGENDFPPGTLLLTFDGIDDGTEVNGLVVSGVTFNYSLGDGQVIIDGGPGETNHISPPNVVSVGDPSGMMKLSLPGPATRFGYGFAILNNGFVANATTITLYNGNNFVGSLSYDGDSDPDFTGGFAGIQSSDPFDTAYISFDPNAAPAWAFDNVMIYNDVPEPGSLLLMGSGVIGIAGLIRRRFLT